MSIENNRDDITEIKRELVHINNKVDNLATLVRRFTFASVRKNISSAVKHIFNRFVKIFFVTPGKFLTAPERSFTVVMLVTYALGVVFGGDLLTDSIRTGIQESAPEWTGKAEIWSYLKESFWQSGSFFTSPYAFSAAFGLIVFCFCAWRLYKMRAGYLVTKYDVLADNGKAKRKILIMGLSKFDPVGDKESYELARKGILSSVIDKEYFSKKNLFFRWQQNLRIMAAHDGLLEKVYLVASSGPDGSYKYETEFKVMCQDIYEKSKKPVPEIHLLIQVDFFKMGEISDKLKQAIDDKILNGKSREQGAEGCKNKDINKYSEKDVCIDITAGTAVLSAAFVMVTTNRKMIFSYVDEEGNISFARSHVSIPEAVGGS